MLKKLTLYLISLLILGILLNFGRDKKFVLFEQNIVE